MKVFRSSYLLAGLVLAFIVIFSVVGTAYSPQILIKRVRMDECVTPGDIVTMQVALENIGDDDLESVRVLAIVEDDRLQIREKEGPFILKENKMISKTLFLEVPEGTQEGQYFVRVSVYDRGIREIRYYPFFVSNTYKGACCCFGCPEAR